MLIPKELKRHLKKLKGNVLQNLNRISSTEAVFTSIYKNRRWGDGESLSGTGSKIEQTRTIVRLLPQIFERYKITRILDIPCGDFHWMQNVNLSDTEYKGADIVADLIQNNVRWHSRDHVNFFVANIIADKLPRVDMVLSRDCLVHFSDRHIFKAIRTIKKSASKFLLTTTFPDHSNSNIVTGSWRALNLQAEPFCLPPPLELFNEGFHPKSSGISDKSLALWRISDLP